MTIAPAAAAQLLPPNREETLYLLPGAFEHTECRAWISSTEARGYAATGGAYPADYRDNDRLLFDDPSLARALLERLRERLPATLERQGARWRLLRLNERFRCCRYGEGQRFVIHRDGPYAPGPRQRSFLTVMLYLNAAGEFRGGQTAFYTDRSGEEVLASIEPDQGDLVVFSHDLWHAGLPVTEGRKYVLRTDVIYEQVTSPAPRELPGARAVLSGHQSYVWSALSLPGDRLVSAGRDGTLRLWSAQGEALQTLRGPWRSLTALALTSRESASRKLVPEGLWAGRRDGGLQRLELTPEGSLSPVLSLEPEPDAGPILALAGLREGGVLSADGRGQLTWRDSAGQVLRRIAAHEGWLWGLTSCDTGWASAGVDGFLRLWSPAGELRCEADLERPLRAIADLGRGCLALGTAAGEVWIWEEGRTRLLGHHEGIVRALLALPGERLASGGEDDRVRLWTLDAPPGEPAELDLGYAQRDFVSSLTLVGDSALASASYDGTLAIWALPEPSVP